MWHVPCPRCENGQMALDKIDNDEFCLQCGYRQPHQEKQEAQQVVTEARDPYEQLVDVVTQALELVKAAASRSDGIAAAHRREAARRRQQVKRITKALKVLKGERLRQASKPRSKPGRRPKLRALPAAEAK